MGARVTSTLTMSTRSLSNPRGSVASRSNVPTRRPAATMSTIDNATWATTRPLDRPVRASPNAPRPCSLSASIGATRLALKAGAVPNSTAVAAVTATVNASTRQSSERSSVTRVTEVDNCATSMGPAHLANTSPASAPMPASTSASTSNSRTRRQRVAPSASRTLNSCRRAVARARSRLAMLPQAIRRTSPTMTRVARRGRSYRRRSCDVPRDAGTSVNGFLRNT